MLMLNNKSKQRFPISNYPGAFLDTSCPEVQQFLHEMESFAKSSRQRVLITGESGTGKSLIAKMIHEISGLEGHFVAFNAPNFEPHLVESTLFGYVKGAFTGADSDHIGLIEKANHGTLFIDESVEISLRIQAKLLQVIQDGIFYKVGATAPTKVKVRIIGATNANVPLLIKQKKVRFDYISRISACSLKTIPLRDRSSDIPSLAYQFLLKFSKMADKNISTISDQAISKLMAHSWPGNIRELEDTIEGAVYNATSETILAEHIIFNQNLAVFEGIPTQNLTPFKIFREPSISKDDKKSYWAKNMNMAKIQSNNNISKAAKLLNISRTHFYRLQVDLKTSGMI